MLTIVSLGDDCPHLDALRRRLGVSQNVLGNNLRGLQRDGYVTRTVAAGQASPEVDYSLTDLSREVLGPVRALAG